MTYCIKVIVPIHMFFAWIICIITGFSLNFEEPVASDVVFKSILLGVACFGLCILLNIIVDKCKAKAAQRKLNKADK